MSNTTTELLPPTIIPPCGPSLTSSPGRVPPPGMVTERPESRRLRAKQRESRAREESTKRGQGHYRGQRFGPRPGVLAKELQ